MITILNTGFSESELDDNYAFDYEGYDTDPDDFERMYQEYLDQGMWIEYENKFTLDTDNPDFVYPKHNDNTELINTYR